MTAGLATLFGFGLGAGFFFAGASRGPLVLAFAGCFATIFALPFIGGLAGAFTAFLAGALAPCFSVGIGFRASEALAGTGFDLDREAGAAEFPFFGDCFAVRDATADSGID